MDENERVDRGISYADVLDILPAADLPVSREDYQTLQDNKAKWYFDYNDLYQELLAKYGENEVTHTKLHHLLAGSSVSISEWEEYDNDTPGGELGQFTQSVIEKYSPQ